MAPLSAEFQRIHAFRSRVAKLDMIFQIVSGRKITASWKFRCTIHRASSKILLNSGKKRLVLFTTISTGINVKYLIFNWGSSLIIVYTLSLHDEIVTPNI